MRTCATRTNQEGKTLLEFAIGGTVFLMLLFGVVEFSRLYWTHNALRDAARRGVRYAAIRRNDAAGQQAVKNMVVYGNPNGGTTPLVNGLTTNNVGLEYVNYNGVQLSSRATVKITNYKFTFAIPMFGAAINMPAYRTSLPGESVGYVPCDLPATNPLASCNIIPN
ncbi:MAG TPA: TadE/TadG family type IV pilus assembly protein [Pyrinomonadaceae bacterium]|nr:TadE/TadG family type IV pilus assembly protein [Pyrinomonadaceae bacterium]